MHIEKYILDSFLKIVNEKGFREFYQKHYKSGKNPEEIPHGYLKKIQYASYNFFVSIVRRTIGLIKKYSNRIEASECIVNLILNENSADLVIKIRKNSRKERIKHNAELKFFIKILQNLCSLIVIKRSVKTKNCELFFSGCSLALDSLFSGGHYKYAQRICQMIFDFDFKWKKEVKNLYSQCFVRKMYYEYKNNDTMENLEDCYENLDECYERSFKEAKNKISTNPSEKLLFTTTMQNITFCFKILRNKKEILHDRKKIEEIIIGDAIKIEFELKKFNFEERKNILEKNKKKICYAVSEFIKRKIKKKKKKDKEVIIKSRLSDIKISRRKRNVKSKFQVCEECKELSMNCTCLRM